MATYIESNGNYVMASKGIRISEENITLDMHPKTAEFVRSALLAAVRSYSWTEEEMTAIRQTCDAIAGPLS